MYGARYLRSNGSFGRQRAQRGAAAQPARCDRDKGRFDQRADADALLYGDVQAWDRCSGGLRKSRLKDRGRHSDPEYLVDECRTSDCQLRSAQCLRPQPSRRLACQSLPAGCPSGYFRQKAKKLKAFVRFLEREYAAR